MLLLGEHAAMTSEVHFGNPGPCQIRETRLVWHDPARKRDVPVLIYEPAGTTGACPPIIFSHGLGGNCDSGSAWGRHWAGHGYLCVHLQHHGSDDQLWRNRAVPLQNMRAAMNATNWIERTRDIRFAIDCLERLNREAGDFCSRIDLAHIGVAGHSFGAGTVLAVCGQSLTWLPGGNGRFADHRIKAGLALSPSVARTGDPSAIYGSIAIPLFCITGTRDDSPISDTKAHHRRIPFDHMPGPDKYLMVLDQADHMVFNGQLPRLGGSPQDETIHRMVKMASLAFWDAELRCNPDAKAWLAGTGFADALRGAGTFERR